MTFKKSLIYSLLFLMSWSIAAQTSINTDSFDTDSLINNQTDAKKFSGKPVIQIFTDFHALFSSPSNSIGFDLERSYLGYKCDFTPSISACLIFDVGVISDDDERVAFAKNAFLSWKLKKLTIDFGLINLKQFDLQQSFWGYRYIMKSFQDLHKFGSSADLGISLHYKFADWLSADLSFSNGEGYKKIVINNKFRYGVGVTVKPISSLTIRCYYDRADKEETDTMGKTQENLSLFIGYQNRFFSVGTECNNLFNANYKTAKNQYGWSAYFTVKLPQHFELYGRWDMLASNLQSQLMNESQMAMIGFQYSPIKYVALAPNFRMLFNNDNIEPQVWFNIKVFL